MQNMTCNKTTLEKLTNRLGSLEVASAKTRWDAAEILPDTLWRLFIPRLILSMQGKNTWFRLMPCWYFLECVLYWANWHLNPHPQFRYTLVVIKTSMTYLDKFRSSHPSDGHGCSMQCWYAHDTEIVHLQKRLEIVVLVSAQRSATLYLTPRYASEACFYSDSLRGYCTLCFAKHMLLGFCIWACGQVCFKSHW